MQCSSSYNALSLDYRLSQYRHGLTNPQDEQTSLRDLLAMEEVLLTGVRALDNASQLIFVQRCVNREHWAGTKKRKATSVVGDTAASDHRGASKKPAKSSATNANTVATGSSEDNTAPSNNAGSATVPTETSTSATATSVPPNTTVPVTFRILVPEVNGALDANFLRGITFVITGTFPEAGGGGESDAGVANVTAMVESFGGKVNARFSKNTSEYTMYYCLQ